MLAAGTPIPAPEEPQPHVAWPTIGLFIFALALWAGSATAWLAGLWAWPVSTLLSAVASYLLFTVSHDAAHHSVARSDRLNLWVGRIATPLFAPHAAFPVWRFIHMQHHRFTNHEDGSDPDAYTMRGPRWQIPFRWLTIDVYYLVFYLSRLARRPRGEKIELAVQLTLIGALTLAAALTGHAFDILVLYYLPCRLAVLMLAWAFDYLPHHGLHHTPEEDRFKGTRNRIGSERLISPVMLYQNYHLVHHLHPLVPFYRYIAVWRRREEDYLAGEPALSTVRGRPLTTDEYLQLRAHRASAARA